MVATILLIVLCAIADRVRGGFPEDHFWPKYKKPEWITISREVTKYTYGIMFAILACGYGAWWMILAGPLWQVGSRQDFGAMFRIYRDEAGGWINIIRVGAVWPLPVLPLAYFDMQILWLWPASITGNYFAQMVADKAPVPTLPRAVLGLDKRNGWAEFLRGGLTAASLVALSGITA